MTCELSPNIDFILKVISIVFTNMKEYFLFLIIILALICVAENKMCSEDELLCDSKDECIYRKLWCDGKNNCADNSDEKYCIEKGGWFSNKDPNECKDTHFLCEDGRCFPLNAACDGIEDCRTGEDEEDGTCVKKDSGVENESETTSDVHDFKFLTTTERAIEQEGVETTSHGPSSTKPEQITFSSSTKKPRHVSRSTASPEIITDVYDDLPIPTDEDDFVESDFLPVAKAVKWLLSQRLPNYGWGKNTPRALVALALAEPERFSNSGMEESLMQKRLQIDISEFIMRNDTRNPLWTNRLASFINAMLATCQDPHNFEDLDLVEMLRKQVSTNERKTRSPSVYLTLCLTNAIGPYDYRLVHDIMTKPEATRWPDLGYVSIMTLQCLNDRLKLSNDYIESVRHFADMLRARVMTAEGKLRNLYSTALAVQAFDAVYGSGQWQSRPAIFYLIDQQNKDDGSFKDFLSMYYSLPAISRNNLLALGSMSCSLKHVSSNELVPLDKLKNFRGPSKFVRYSLFNGYPVTSSYSIQMTVPSNTSFFDIMRLAQDSDVKFKFEYTRKGDDVYVYSIADRSNDIEKGLQWQHGVLGNGFTPSIESVRKIIPRNGEHLTFWYTGELSRQTRDNYMNKHKLSKVRKSNLHN